MKLEDSQYIMIYFEKTLVEKNFEY